MKCRGHGPAPADGVAGEQQERRKLAILVKLLACRHRADFDPVFPCIKSGTENCRGNRDRSAEYRNPFVNKELRTACKGCRSKVTRRNGGFSTLLVSGAGTRLAPFVLRFLNRGYPQDSPLIR